jgi:putative selenate reductase
MAQNLVLSWLGGSRILELKTVQVRDDLEIPRPCIDMRTVGLNAEWSQELEVHESLEEYVKGAMLIEMLRASGRLRLADGFGDCLFDISVGYDLEGIRSDKVAAFLRGMLDAGPVVERLRDEIPAELGELRDLPFPTRLSDTVTLSTFHGCPPDEIEGIIEHLLDEYGFHCIVKLNPMLLGAEETRQLLYDELGYDGFRVPDSAFERDATWDQAVGFVERLGAQAKGLGLGFGVKLTNTLIVENDHGFLPGSEPEVYLSGPPLHVLSMHLARRFRRRFGGELPISFSAGVDRGNFADAAALGLVPVTTCTDLLKKGGYGRQLGYYTALAQRMDEVGARTLDEFTLLAFGHAEDALDRLEPAPDARTLERCRAALAARTRGGSNDLRAAAGGSFTGWVAAAKVLDTESYVERLTDDPRYSQPRNATAPRKIGRHLELFNCLTCDLCIPVCPNDAMFRLPMEPGPIPVIRVRREGGTWRGEREGAHDLTERHQIAVFADFCNECGNCDVFCPEDGGPYVMKPRFFRRREDWEGSPHLDGFHFERRAEVDEVRGRFEGRSFFLQVERSNGTARFEGTMEGEGFRLRFDLADPAGSVEGEGPDEVDLTYGLILDRLRRAILDPAQVNYLNSLSGGLPAADPARNPAGDPAS